jgi:hypothetical protein
MWLKVGIAVGPLAILDKINLKCMLVIMIKDSNLMCHDFNLLQTLVTITETHWRRVNRGEVGFVIMMKRKWAEASICRRH